MERLERLYMNSVNKNKKTILYSYCNLYAECLKKKLELLIDSTTETQDPLQQLIKKRNEIDFEILLQQLRDFEKLLYD